MTFIVQTKECETKVFSESPFYFKNYLDVPANFYQIDICYLNYSHNQVQQLIKSIQDNQPIEFSFSANLDKKL